MTEQHFSLRITLGEPGAEDAEDFDIEDVACVTITVPRVPRDRIESDPLVQQVLKIFEQFVSGTPEELADAIEDVKIYESDLPGGGHGAV